MPTRGTRGCPERTRPGVRPPGAAIAAALAAAVLLAGPPSGSAADKSGVTPNAISLPSGPGSIEGLGESFQPTLNTGTAKYAIPLTVPPGTAGHAPALALSYEGGAGNGPLGFGWSLGIPFVQRMTEKGVPRYLDAPNNVDDDGDGEVDEADELDAYINQLGEELVPTAEGYWFCKNEGAFIRYRKAGDHWEAHLPDGTLLEFGLSSEGRLAEGGRTFRWLLERETDPNGNEIVYSYGSFPEVQNLNQRYLASIRYGPGAAPWDNFHFVRFSYEDRLDWLEDCRAGFPVRTGRRLKAIVVGTQGPTLPGHLAGDFSEDGVADNLVRRYDFGYLDYAGSGSHSSLLASVRLVGADGSTSLPPLTMGYTVSDPPASVSAAGSILGGVDEPPLVMDSPLVDFVDLNADGLPDVLRTFLSGGAHQGYLNLGLVDTSSGPALRWSSPVEVGGDLVAWNVNLESTSDIAHLGDMDGDGLADLVYKSAADDVYFFRNEVMQWGPRQLMSIVDTSPPSPYGNAEVRTGDVNGDKRMDIIQSVSAGAGVDYRVWFNLGGRRYSRGMTVPQDNGVSLSLSGVHLADFNGDHLPDVVRVRPDSVEVTPGLGDGRFSAPHLVVITDRTLDTDQVGRARLADVTGDGLNDLVLERAAPGVLWYWVNLGNYALSARKEVTGLPTGIGLSAATRWADVNGNGSTDLVYADSQSEPRLQCVDLVNLLSGGLAPNLLTTVANGIGRVTVIGYASSVRYSLEDAALGKPWPDPMPNPVHVVSRVTTFDSLGHEYLTEFRYHNGYYDDEEHQFRGFARVEQVEVGDPTAPTLVTRSHFDTGREHEAMKGKLLRVTAEQADGKVFWDESMTWTNPPRILTVGSNGTSIAFAHPVSRVKTVTELGQGTERRLESEFAYDEYGNQTLDADYGIVVAGDRSASDDERRTVIEYALNVDAWVLRMPKRKTVSDENGVVSSRTEYFYDDETFSGTNFGEVTRGRITARRVWVDPRSTSLFVNSVRTKYDEFGNPVLLLDPLARAPGGAVDLAGGHAREIQYDTSLRANPVGERIHPGGGGAPLVFQVSVDAGFGTVLNAIDFNGNITHYGYDALARLVEIVKPYDSPEYPTVEYQYELSVPSGRSGIVNYTETRRLDRTPGTADDKRGHYLITRVYVDGLGRRLMTKAEAEPYPDSAIPRVVISEAVTFNSRKLPGRVINPCFSLQGSETLEGLLAFEQIDSSGWRCLFHSEGGEAALGIVGAHQNTSHYDATLRATRTTHSDGTYRLMEFEPLLVRTYDENDTNAASAHFNTPVIRWYDGLNRLVQVDEVTALSDDGRPTGTLSAWTTRYQYDLNDQITRMIDAQNNVKITAYDSLKRTTFMNDPDRGVMSFAYDDASNLVETVDAKGQRITYTYDGINRLLTERYHDDKPMPPWRTSGEGLSNSVVYHYDVPFQALPQGDGTSATARNTRGKLAWVEDTSGEEHLSYDNRGRVEWVAKRIPDVLLPLPSSLVTYRTGFSYDSSDRNTVLTYPDADQVAYEYNERGLLKRISGAGASIVSNIAYLPSALELRVDHGNGIRSTYAYDSRQRLRELAAVSQPSTLHRQLMDFWYSYDGASNTISIDDRRPGSVVPGGDLRRNSQIFWYDDLYRLARVQYSLALPGDIQRNDGEIEYRYDRIGNMIAQTSTLNHWEHGFPVADLGEMESGGSGGRWGRNGRLAGDPPGPHALTQIRNGALQIPPRDYPYDANGNMLFLDGATNTWDFKDRLVAVEKADMRAEYAYDYMDRRVTKRVNWKAGAPDPDNPGSRLAAPRAQAVSYVSKFFEVREHDAPVKYVWRGDTRVCRVTGSLSSTSRIQRLRLVRGWNLVSAAVTGILSSFGEEGGVVTSAYKWNSMAHAWEPVAEGALVSAGSVLWVDSDCDATIALVGDYAEPQLRTVPAGGDFVAGAGMEVWDLRSILLGLALNAWLYDNTVKRWLAWLPAPLEHQTDMPSLVSPGLALFVHVDAPAELSGPDPALRLLFYHQDNLGSSSVTTDGVGEVVEERAYYPFGHSRQRVQSRQTGHAYGFSQKEQDRESDLHYFGARFYAAHLGRFLSHDPLHVQLGALTPGSLLKFLEAPQSLNTYGYCLQNPLKYIDPEGRDVAVILGDPVYDKRGEVNLSEAAAVRAVADLKKRFKDEGLDPETVHLVKGEDVVRQQRYGTRFGIAEGKPLSAVIVVGHGSPGQVYLPTESMPVGMSPSKLAEVAKLDKDGVVAAIACNVGNVRGSLGPGVIADRGNVSFDDQGRIAFGAGRGLDFKPIVSTVPSNRNDDKDIGSIIVEAERARINSTQGSAAP